MHETIRSGQSAVTERRSLQMCSIILPDLRDWTNEKSISLCLEKEGEEQKRKEGKREREERESKKERVLQQDYDQKILRDYLCELIYIIKRKFVIRIKY